ATPDQSRADVGKSLTTKPGTSKADTEPADTEPADTAKADTAKPDTQTTDTRTTGTQTTDTQTTDTQPAGTQTTHTRTTDEQPADAQPADTQYAGTTDSSTVADNDAGARSIADVGTPLADPGAAKPTLSAGIIPTQPSPADAAEATSTRLRPPVTGRAAPESGDANGANGKALRADTPLPETARSASDRAGDIERTTAKHRAEDGETHVEPRDKTPDETPDETSIEVPAELISAVEATRTAARVAVPTAWSGIVADPGHTPELLALAAVQLIGPRAADWAREARESYPSADPAAIARLAVQRFSRRAGIANAFAAVAGTYAPVALLGTTGWTHAELVLHVAAAFGQDPTDLARAADLLVLTRVHPTHEDAHAAIAATMEPAPQGETGPGDAVWRLGRMAANQTAGWLALRAVSRFFPGTALLVTALMSRSGAENLGVRAVAYYRAAAERP
ncbi:MAG TPA: hypothetical protein VF657_20300, partial [Actinoplanes sp.]